MQVDIEKKYLDQVKSIINSVLQNDTLKIYVFGSRATGKAKKYSDLDIALKSNTKIDSEKMSKLAIELENTTIPYEIDIIDLNNITDSFKKCIEKNLVEI